MFQRRQATEGEAGEESYHDGNIIASEPYRSSDCSRRPWTGGCGGPLHSTGLLDDGTAINEADARDGS